MKLKSFFTLCLSLHFFNNYSQCTYKDIFPFNSGMTKKQIGTIVYENFKIENFKLEKDTSFKNKTDTSKYELGVFKIRNNSCFGYRDNKASIRLVNDSLFEITILIEFSASELVNCDNYYKKMLNDLYNYFPISTIYNPRQDGTGTSLFKSFTSKKSNKPERIELSYHPNYELDLQTQTPTDEIIGYTLEIKYSDLKYIP